jgi:hypothetical protein
MNDADTIAKNIMWIASILASGGGNMQARLPWFTRATRHPSNRSFMFFRQNKNAEPSGSTAAAVFWGASDRMICCKGIAGELNEFNTTSHAKLAQQGYVATLEISDPAGGQGLFIHAMYSGHWSFAVSPSSEDSDELPGWTIKREWGTVNQHSETLTIQCPEGSSVRAIDRIVND